jgi:acetyl/propionyl-CoA carboxylase alpha subunit
MFKKILIANRGEIAVRIARTCRDLGIATVALYDETDVGSLHVRLADECARLTSSLGYVDQDEVIRHALAFGAEAIHPGYGFLAEQPDFIRACGAAGLVFIGPPAEVVATLKDKIATLRQAAAAGFPTPRHSAAAYTDEQIDELRAEAERIGYPVVIKSCSGGRGRGTRVVRSPDKLAEGLAQAQAGSVAVFRDRRVYLEQAILPSRYVEVQLLGDQQGHLIHLGERDSSIQRNNQKIITESPAPYLSPAKREQLWSAAIAIARLFGCYSACTVEFVVDEREQFYFTEIKPRIQVEHTVTEMIAAVDIVRSQIRTAAGLPLTIRQEDVQLRGCAMQCRIKAEDPWNGFLPSPGQVELLRLPGGPYVRVDTYAYSGCDIPLRYDPMFAKLIVWGRDRADCLNRMHRALEETFITGIQTNLPLLQQMFADSAFVDGCYTTEFSRRPLAGPGAPPERQRELAAIAAVLHALRSAAATSAQPERLQSGWHRSSRRLPS